MRIQSLILGFKGLKGLCHEDTTVFGQFCAEVSARSRPRDRVVWGGGGGHPDP